MVKVVTGDIPEEALAASRRVQAVGMDIETSRLKMIDGRLDKTDGRIAMVQVYIPNYGTIMIRRLNAWPTNLSKLLENENTAKIFHYASFDLYFLMRDLPLVYPTNIADTMIAAKFYDPNKTKFVKSNGIGSHSLSVLVETLFGYKMNKDLAVSDWFATDLSKEQLEYAAKDVEYLPSLLDYMEQRINANLLPDLFAAYRFLPHSVMIELKVGKNVFGYE